jgi:hypothetical protein
MIGMWAASKSAQTAALRGSRTTATRVNLASWSIVSLVMTGPSSLSRESRPAHQPIPAGLGAHPDQAAVDNYPLCRRVFLAPFGLRTHSVRRPPCLIDC